MEGKTTEELLAIYEGDEESGESIKAAGSALRKRGKTIPSRAKLRIKRILYFLIGTVFSIIMFEKELEERTADEVAYDNIIIEELRKGSSIKKALKIAAEKYPDEALQYDDETIGDIESHYDYLLKHEAIKNRIKIG